MQFLILLFGFLAAAGLVFLWRNRRRGRRLMIGLAVELLLIGGIVWYLWPAPLLPGDKGGLSVSLVQSKELELTETQQEELLELLDGLRLRRRFFNGYAARGPYPADQYFYLRVADGAEDVLGLHLGLDDPKQCYTDTGARVLEPESLLLYLDGLLGEYEHPDPAPPATEYSFSDIEAALREIAVQEVYVIEVRDAGKYTVVHYTNSVPAEGETPESAFAWFYRDSGEFWHNEAIVGKIEDFQVTEDGMLQVLTTAEPRIEGGPVFPQVLSSHAESRNMPYPVLEARAPYYAPLDRPYDSGPGRAEQLRDVQLDEQGLRLSFGPQEGTELLQYIAGSESAPGIKVENRDGQAFVTLYNVLPAADFVLPDNVGIENMDCDGTNTVLTLDIGEAVRYAIGAGIGKQEFEYQDKNGTWTYRETYLTLHYVDADFPLNYPAGW